MARPKDIPFQLAVHAPPRSIFWLFFALALSACTTLPRERVLSGLYIDARKALNGESRLGWTVDRVELEQAAAETEPSACRVDKEQRDQLRAWIDAQIAKAGGPAEAQYKAGRHIDDLDDVIDLERAHGLLDQVELHLPADCPFWVKPEKNFDGLHQTTRRFTLIAESMGAGSLLISRHVGHLGGGGAARVFTSYGFSPSLQWAVGVEGGGDAILQDNGRGQLSPAGAFRFGVPSFLRILDVDRIYDIELAAVSRADHGHLRPWGGRIAFAGGVTGLRRIGFMPALQLWLGYEIYPAQNGLPAQHAIRLGTRVGFDWDP